MILQRLYQDYDCILQQTGQKGEIPSMYEMKPLRWILEVPTDPSQLPRFIPIIGEGKKGERGIERPLPSTKRAGLVIRPFLLADTPAYVLGLLFPDDLKGKDEVREKQRTQEKFSAFRGLTRECAKATQDPGIMTITHFLDTWDPEHPVIPIPTEMSGAHTILLQVTNTQSPIESPAVQAFWASRGREDEGNTTISAAMQCLVSGKLGPVEEIMPVPVKGLPGGQPTGTHLVSANFVAVESYGLQRAQTSPISRDAGERFGKALNALLASPNHRVTLQNVAYVFWAQAETTPTLWAFQPEPDVAAIRHLFDSVRRGQPWSSLPDTTAFYLFGLSANVARAVVRSTIETTVGEIGRAQAAWFRRQELIGPDGEVGHPLGLKTLAVAPYRDFKEIAPGVEDALVQAAFYGRPLPNFVLQAVVQRCRLDHEHRVTYPRAVLLKYLLCQEMPEKEDIMKEEITGEMPSAYHCGRLFSELEEIQRQALPGINATIADKFFGSASSSPASVFGILLSGAQNHLAKLRKEREGAFHGAQKRMEEILAEIGDFPKTLTLKDQALFSLGYYHHRATKRKDIAEHTAAKKRSAIDTTETTQPEEATR